MLVTSAEAGAWADSEAAAGAVNRNINVSPFIPIMYIFQVKSEMYSITTAHHPYVITEDFNVPQDLSTRATSYSTVPSTFSIDHILHNPSAPFDLSTKKRRPTASTYDTITHGTFEGLLTTTIKKPNTTGNRIRSRNLERAISKLYSKMSC